MVNPKRETRKSELEPERWQLRDCTLIGRLQVSSLELRAFCSVLLLAVALTLGFRLFRADPPPLLGYSPEQNDVYGQPFAVTWEGGRVTWQVNCAIGANIQLTSDSGCPTEAPIQAAFNSWSMASLAAGPVLTGIQVSEGPATTLTDPDAASNAVDCVNIVSFVPSAAVKFPTGVVAFTTVATVTQPIGQPLPFNYQCNKGSTSTTQTCSQPSCIIDGDIMFNPGDPFSTAQPTPSNAFDIQSVATHEVGHMLGLDHDGIAHSVMYPFGDAGLGRQRYLSTDDALGIAVLYPGSSFSSSVGTLAGQVTLNGTPAFAAHIVAIDSATGNAVVDGLTDMQGNFNLAVPPGSYSVLALPLGGPFDLGNFGAWSCGYAGSSASSPPCCQPGTPTCTGTPLQNSTSFTGTFLN